MARSGFDQPIVAAKSTGLKGVNATDAQIEQDRELNE